MRAVCAWYSRRNSAALSSPASAITRIGDEGIAASLLAEGGRGAMPRNEGDIVAQWKQLAADAVDQLLVVTAREIRATDGTLEKHITDPGNVLRRIVEHHVPGSVPGTVQHLKLLLAHADRIALLQPAVGQESVRVRETGHR